MSNRLPKGMCIVPTNEITITRLYDTNIVMHNHVNNTITFNSNNWRTKHTKKCTNLYINKLGLYLYQKNYTWYVVDNKEVIREYKDGLELQIA